MTSYDDYIAKIKASGKPVMAYVPPCGCDKIETPVPPHDGQTWDSLVTCPKCGALHMKIATRNSVIAFTPSDDLDTSKPWTQYPERMTREQLIAALECVDNLTNDYARGEARGGSMDWEDVDSTFEATKVHFPNLYDEKLAAMGTDDDRDDYLEFARARPDAFERYDNLYEMGEWDHNRDTPETRDEFVERASEQDADDDPESWVFIHEWVAHKQQREEYLADLKEFAR